VRQAAADGEAEDADDDHGEDRTEDEELRKCVSFGVVSAPEAEGHERHGGDVAGRSDDGERSHGCRGCGEGGHEDFLPSECP